MALSDLIQEEHFFKKTTEDTLVDQVQWPLLLIVQAMTDLTVLTATNATNAPIANVLIVRLRVEHLPIVPNHHRLQSSSTLNVLL